MTEDIRKAIEKTLTLEGGYVDDPDDLGGETKYGISHASYPSLDIKNLTKDDAAKIAYVDYWLPMQLEGLPLSVAWKLFDIAFNRGKIVARDFKRRIEGKSETESELMLIELQAKGYAAIVRNNPNQAKFVMGWMNRAFERYAK